MRVLYCLEPFHDLASPYVMEAWLIRFQRMHEQLKIFSDDYEGRLLTWEAYDYRLQGYFSEEKISLSQAELRLDWHAKGMIVTRLEWNRASDGEVEKIQNLMRRKVEGFRPDIVVLLSASEWLKLVFPGALFLNAEATWLYTPPQFDLWQLDPCGFGKGRGVVDNWSHWSESFQFGPDQEAFCADLKVVFRNVVGEDQALIEKISDLRKSFDRIVLVPLGDYAPSDGETPVMSLLDWYLEKQDQSTAYLITNHPNAPALAGRQGTYLSSKYPNLILDPGFRTNLLFPHVDSVLGDFTSVSSHALLFEKQVVSLGNDCPFLTPRFRARSPLCVWLENTAEPEIRDKMLYWLITHYSIPAERLHNGIWLDAFFRRALTLHAGGEAWRVFSEPIVSMEEWSSKPWFSQALNPHEKPIDPAAEALKVRTDTDRKIYQQAESKLESGNQVAAVELLQSLVDAGSPLWEPYNDLAALAAGEGDFSRARELLKRALRVDPEARQARINLVSVEFALQQYDVALAELGPLMRSEPSNPEVFNLAKEIVGVAPALSTIAWIRLVADIRSPVLSQLGK